MDELNASLPENPAEPSPNIPAAATESTDRDRTRRDFLHGSARKLAYAAPLIMLFHPTPACASNGSQLTQA